MLLLPYACIYITEKVKAPAVDLSIFKVTDYLSAAIVAQDPEPDVEGNVVDEAPSFLMVQISD